MRVWIGGGRIGTATSDDDDSDVAVETEEDVEAFRCRRVAEVTRAKAGNPVGGVGGVEAGEVAVAAIMPGGCWHGQWKKETPCGGCECTPKASCSIASGRDGGMDVVQARMTTG